LLDREFERQLAFEDGTNHDEEKIGSREILGQASVEVAKTEEWFVSVQTNS
jgi:hypothetical protein